MDLGPFTPDWLSALDDGRLLVLSEGLGEEQVTVIE